jgi:uncharacterized glyoxalase superfamily protein PhnB
MDPGPRPLHNRSMPRGVVVPVLRYAEVPAAAAWLCRAFGFQERLRVGSHRVQLGIGRGGAVIVAQGPGDPLNEAPLRCSVMVRVADADAHCARASAAGARLLLPPADHAYGERQYTAMDCGGHVWTFSQTLADVDPAAWGGALVEPEATR